VGQCGVSPPRFLIVITLPVWGLSPPDVTASDTVTTTRANR